MWLGPSRVVGRRSAKPNMRASSSQRLCYMEDNTYAAVHSTHRRNPNVWLVRSSLPERCASRMPCASTTEHFVRVEALPDPLPSSPSVQRQCSVHRSFASAAALAHRPSPTLCQASPHTSSLCPPLTSCNDAALENAVSGFCSSLYKSQRRSQFWLSGVAVRVQRSFGGASHC